MQHFHPIWDPAWLVWMAILSAIAGVAWLVVIGGLGHWLVVGRKPRRRNGWDLLSVNTMGLWVAGIAVAFALLFGVIGTFVAFPFSGQYHRYVPVTGIVSQQVTSRFIASDTSGGGSTQKFLVMINGQPYGCNDTRCSNLAKGDRVTLMCERSWQWSGTPGYDCNWGALLGKR